MPYLVAGLVLVGAVASLNLILTTAIVRRMRVYERGRTPYDVLGGLPEGAALPSFTATTRDGALVSDRQLRDRPALVAFLSTDCPGCLERAPDVAAAARDTIASGGRAVAVIIEGAEAVGALTAAVEPATIVYEPVDRSGPMTRAFAVKSFPTFFAIDSAGRVTARELAAAEPVATGGA